MSTQPSPPQTHILLTHPRTASHLLHQILNLPSQPSIHPTPREGYFFLPTMQIRTGPNGTYGHHISSLTPAQRTALMKSYRTSHSNLDSHITAAHKSGKSVYIKEHVGWLTEPVSETRFIFGEASTHEEPWTINSDLGTGRSEGNDTVLPDALLLCWKPTFLIRHPGLVFPSIYRTSVDNEGVEATRAQGHVHRLEMTFRWSKRLYEWFAGRFEEGGKWPVVLDADDVMVDSELVVRYAEMVGLDAGKLRFTWDKKSEEETKRMGSAERRMRSTIDASTGIVEGKTSVGLDLDVEAGKWREEFGEEDGKMMEKWVRDAMEDYEYLKARRFR